MAAMAKYLVCKVTVAAAVLLVAVIAIKFPVPLGLQPELSVPLDRPPVPNLHCPNISIDNCKVLRAAIIL